MMKKIMYNILLFVSIVLILLLNTKIGNCEEKIYNWHWYGSSNTLFIILLSGLFLFIEFIIYTIDGLMLLIYKITKAEVNNSELICLVGSVLIIIFWLFILGTYSNNGSCDVIIGPAETGLFLAMLASTIINFWKILSLKRKKNKPVE